MLEARQLSLFRRDKTLLDKVALSFEPGKITAIVGPNGAGKSSLLKILAGVLLPDQGEVLLHGKKIQHYNALQKAQYCGFLSQKPTLAFDLNVKQVLALGRYPYRSLSAQLNEEVVCRYLKLFDLEKLQSHAYSTLSGGEQQRLHLARLLAQIDNNIPAHQKFLLLDEHMAHLDWAYHYWTFNYLKKIAEQGVAVLIVSHDINMLKQYADDMIVLDKGRLYTRAKPSQALVDELLLNVFKI
ncbi:MAG: hemin transporter ATP-binding protein [Gammaproteobacteria bacterium]|jgi:iron complex transport system ATP-binding protein|nr:hemin transporter ATP-binding protein [Gammaproteobacteria bacterium]